LLELKGIQAVQFDVLCAMAAWKRDSDRSRGSQENPNVVEW
jgi:hypothetical protein